MAELRPKTTQQMRKVASGAVATTTALYMLIAIGSYLVFGEAIQSDVLHNFTPQSLVAVVPVWLAELLCVTVRLSFLLGIVTLFPLMVRPWIALGVTILQFLHLSQATKACLMPFWRPRIYRTKL